MSFSQAMTAFRYSGDVGTTVSQGEVTGLGKELTHAGTEQI